MKDFVRLHIWLPGTQPESNPASLIINTPDALEFVLQAFYHDRQIYDGACFHVVARQDENVVASGKYGIEMDGRLTIYSEENFKMGESWNVVNGLTPPKAG